MTFFDNVGESGNFFIGPFTMDPFEAHAVFGELPYLGKPANDHGNVLVPAVFLDF